MKLYSYYRSSAAYRVRIGLNLKGLDYTYLPVNLLEKANKSPQYLDVNPQGLVPAMELPGGDVVAQSVALLEWLEDSYPDPPFLPDDPLGRVRVRSLVNSIACDIHPLCNLAVTNYLRVEYQANDQNIIDWYCTWMHRSFIPIEQVLAENASTYSFSEQPCMADIVLVPQIYNARRFAIALEAFPHIRRVVDNCNRLPAFASAAPEMQADSPDQER